MCVDSSLLWGGGPMGAGVDMVEAHVGIHVRMSVKRVLGTSSRSLHTVGDAGGRFRTVVFPKSRLRLQVVAIMQASAQPCRPAVLQGGNHCGFTLTRYRGTHMESQVIKCDWRLPICRETHVHAALDMLQVTTAPPIPSLVSLWLLSFVQHQLQLKTSCRRRAASQCPTLSL